MRHTPSIRFAITVLFILVFATACGSAGQSAAQEERAAIATGVIDAPVTTPSPQPPPMGAAATATFEPMPVTPTAETATPTEAALDLCDADQQVGNSIAVQHISIDRPEGTTPTRATSWIAFDGIEALAWTSHWIVQARIAAECGDTEARGLSYYVIEVERTFRGPVRDIIKVQGIGDPFGSRPKPAVGDEMMLFLSPPSDSPYGAESWVTGGPQGTWQIENGLASAEYDSLALTAEEFGLAIAEALANDPPEGLPIPAISLEASPLGPDLPQPGASQPAGCGGTLSPMAFQGRETLRLLWSSRHVFAGTVMQQLPSFQVEEPEPETDPLLRPIVTDYLVQIQNPIRGPADDVIRIRRLGGEIDGCSALNAEEPLFAVGKRVMVFVWTPEPEADDPTYYLNGGIDGFWRFAHGEALVVREGAEYRASVVLPTQQFTDGLLTALYGDPVPYDGSGLETVPLDAAPAAQPQSWPELARDSSITWVPYQHQSSGLSLDHPEGWTTRDTGDPGAISLANFPTEGGDWESIPDGGLRIDIEALDGPSYGSQTPLSVGRAGYPGSIDFFPGILGDTYHVYLAYKVDGQVRQMAGYFKEPADLSNPNLQTFFAIVASIQHGPQNGPTPPRRSLLPRQARYPAGRPYPPLNARADHSRRTPRPSNQRSR